MSNNDNDEYIIKQSTVRRTTYSRINAKYT